MKNLFIDPSLSIIIVSYNCKDLLAEAIESVYTFVKTSFEIIVVDNASSDGTEKKIRSSFPEIKFIANTTNMGFSAANNQGFAIASGKNILLLNPDAKLINTDLEKGLHYLDLNPDTIIGPKILNPDLSLQGSVIALPTVWDVFKEAFFLGYFFKESIPEILKQENYGLTGACLLLTSKNYGLLNGLDENLFWMDDMDFCYRAKKMGLKIHYFEDWSIIHLIGQSGKKNYKVSISNQLISKLKYFKKHDQKFDFVFSAIFLQFHIASRILFFLLLIPFKSVYRMKFSAYFYAQSLFFRYIFTTNKKTF